MDASPLVTIHNAHTSSCGEPPTFIARTDRKRGQEGTKRGPVYVTLCQSPPTMLLRCEAMDHARRTPGRRRGETPRGISPAASDPAGAQFLEGIRKPTTKKRPGPP